MEINNENFDWVKARSECSIAEVFEQLKMQIEQDVEKRKSIVPNNADNVFTLVKDVNAIRVIQEGSQYKRVVSVELKDNSIRILDPLGKELHIATLTLNNEGECRLKVKDKELMFWQFRRLALESVLFGN